WSAPGAEGARATAVAAGVERHGGGVSEGAVRARAVHGAGGADSGCGGGGVRGTVAELCAAGSSLEPGGVAAARVGCGCGCGGGFVYPALGGDGDRAVGDLEGRRCVFAVGPELPAGAA